MKRVQLAHGNIAPGSILLVELIKNSRPDAHTVLVALPHVGEVSLARFAEVVSNDRKRSATDGYVAHIGRANDPVG